MLRSVAIPDASSINFHPIERFSTDSSKQHPNLPLDNVPVFTQVDHVHTNFIYVRGFNLIIFKSIKLWLSILHLGFGLEI